MAYANPDAVTQIANGLSTSTFSYDQNGNLTQKTVDGTTTTYVYDYANRLTALGVLGATTTYGYDAFGQRVLQTGTTTTYFYPFKWYSVASSTGSGAKYATTTDYVFNTDTLLATADQQTASGVATGTAKTRYVHPDHLGSTNVVTDENGGLVQTLDYYPYGATRISVATSTNEKRKFIDQFTDDSGLSYLNARYYNQTQGQFITQDPTFSAVGNPNQLRQLSQQSQQKFLSDPQQMNSYSYANDNPITKKDPSGLSIWEPISIGGEAIDQAQYFFNLGKYASMNSQQRTEEAPKITFESLTSLPGLVMFASPVGTQLMLANFALQGLDYSCTKITCKAWGSASNGMTPQQIAQQVLASAGPSSSLLDHALYSQAFGTSGGAFNNIFSSFVQARIDATKSFNSGTGNSSGSGGAMPSNNSLWVTPSGAVVSFGGQLIAPPPAKKN
jgi:RHS repeat-associated protein